MTPGAMALSKLTYRMKSPETARAVSGFRKSIFFPKRVHFTPQNVLKEKEEDDIKEQLWEINAFNDRITLKETQQWQEQLMDPNAKIVI